MWCKKLISYFSFRLIVFSFIIWSNSSCAPFMKNVGFYCDDESIKHPYYGDTIHFIYLLVVVLCFFPFLIYTTEVMCGKKKNDGELDKNLLRKLLNNYFSGVLFVLGFTEVLKVSCCELRPHFFTTCLPDMKNIKCSDGFITQFNCTGKGPSFLLERDIYKSFPSGHASLSLYSFVFLNIYLYSRMKNKTPTLTYQWWSRIIPLTTFIWTVICCISRILDNRHFWWDVLVGIFIGFIGGFVSIRMSLKTAFMKINARNDS